jgi:hypothetical protein
LEPCEASQRGEISELPGPEDRELLESGEAAERREVNEPFAGPETEHLKSG